MAQLLLAFQQGTLYLDAVILEAFLDSLSPWHATCRELFRRAITPPQPIRLVTATLTIDETIFVLLQELLTRPPYQITRSRSPYLQGHPEIVRQLMAVVDPLVQPVPDAAAASITVIISAGVGTARESLAIGQVGPPEQAQGY